MYKSISSPHNKEVKQVMHLSEKSRMRRKENRFVVEGLREIRLALEADFHFHTLYFCPDLMAETDWADIRKAAAEKVELSEAVYKKMAYRGSTEGILGIAECKGHELGTVRLPKKKAFVLVAEAPEKPGNIGALLRTADAAKVDAVFIANPRTDLYNPNIIRSSVGCVFTNQIGMGPSSEIMAFLKAHNISIFCAALQASENYTAPDYTGSTAIVVGTEADGLEQEWLENSIQNIIIPMAGKNDSMNVSVSAGILLFEVKRQRGFYAES